MTDLMLVWTRRNCAVSQLFSLWIWRIVVGKTSLVAQGMLSNGLAACAHMSVTSVTRMCRVERAAARDRRIENYDKEDEASVENLRVAVVRRLLQRF